VLQRVAACFFSEPPSIHHPTHYVQYVAARCSVLQRVAVCCSVFTVGPHALIIPQSVLQCVATRCSMLQCVYREPTNTHHPANYAATLYNVLQRVGVCRSVFTVSPRTHIIPRTELRKVTHVQISCNTLQHPATLCNTKSKQDTARHCKTLHGTATHLVVPTHTATHCNFLRCVAVCCTRCANSHCNTLQLLAVCCSVLQRLSVYRNTTHTKFVAVTHKVCCGSHRDTARCCSVLQCPSVCYITPHTRFVAATRKTRCGSHRDTAKHCKTLQHSATQCNRVQHTALHIETLQHTATRRMSTRR